MYELLVYFVRLCGWEGSRGKNNLCSLYKSPKVQRNRKGKNKNYPQSHHTEISTAGVFVYIFLEDFLCMLIIILYNCYNLFCFTLLFIMNVCSCLSIMLVLGPHNITSMDVQQVSGCWTLKLVAIFQFHGECFSEHWYS